MIPFKHENKWCPLCILFVPIFLGLIIFNLWIRGYIIW